MNELKNELVKNLKVVGLLLVLATCLSLNIYILGKISEVKDSVIVHEKALVGLLKGELPTITVDKKNVSAWNIVLSTILKNNETK